MSNEFKAPKGWEGYTNSVVDKTRLLISLGIWEGVDMLDLNRWLKNFKDQEGKYLSACILDAFTYRSKKMCHSMMRNILMDMVPNFCRNNNVANFNSITEWKYKLAKGNELVRFVPVNIQDGKVKSSSVIARHFLEANDLQQRFIQQSEFIKRAVDNGTKVIVFLDDFSGTGKQFIRFINENPIDSLPDYVKFLYAPLCAHVDAIDGIIKKVPKVKIMPIDKLTKEHGFFTSCDKGYFRGDGVNTVKAAKDYYINLFDGCSNRENLLGYGCQEITYSFFMSTPNNNLKALYHYERDAWNRLVFRSQA